VVVSLTAAGQLLLLAQDRLPPLLLLLQVLTVTVMPLMLHLLLLVSGGLCER
jgi:hypothetical protein